MIACGDPSSFIRIISLSKLFGTPERLVVIDVIAVASVVMVTASALSVLIVGVAELIIVVTLGTSLVVIVDPVFKVDPLNNSPEPIVTADQVLVPLRKYIVCVPESAASAVRSPSRGW